MNTINFTNIQAAENFLRNRQLSLSIKDSIVKKTTDAIGQLFVNSQIPVMDGDNMIGELKSTAKISDKTHRQLTNIELLVY